MPSKFRFLDVFPRFALYNNSCQLFTIKLSSLYRLVQNVPLFEFPAFFLPTNLGQPISPDRTSLTKFSSPSFARPCTFANLIALVEFGNRERLFANDECIMSSEVGYIRVHFCLH